MTQNIFTTVVNGQDSKQVTIKEVYNVYLDILNQISEPKELAYCLQRVGGFLVEDDKSLYLWNSHFGCADLEVELEMKLRWSVVLNHIKGTFSKKNLSTDMFDYVRLLSDFCKLPKYLRVTINEEVNKESRFEDFDAVVEHFKQFGKYFDPEKVERVLQIVADQQYKLINEYGF